jgi:hypothetical protein
MQGLRRQIHVESPFVRAAFGEMPGVQEARAKGLFRFQHAAQAQTVVGYGRQESGI